MLDGLELELQKVVSYHLGAGEQTQFCAVGVSALTTVPSLQFSISPQLWPLFSPLGGLTLTAS